jgi:outer membrane protein TolC
MSRTRQFVALFAMLAIVSIPSLGAQELRSTPLPVDQVLRITLTENADIKNNDLDVSIARDRTASARTNFFPQVHAQAMGLQLLTPLNFRFNKGVFGRYPIVGPIPGEKINVSTDQQPVLFVNTAIVQPILQIPRIAVAVKQSQVAAVIAQQKARIQRQQIGNQVRRAYYKALELENGLKVTEATSAMYREIDRTTQEYLARQAVLRSEALQVKQELSKVDLETTKLRNAIASAKEEMNQLMGRDLRNDFSLVMIADPPEQDIDLQAAQARALCGRAEITQLANQVTQLGLEKRLKRLDYLPDLNLVVDYFSIFGSQILPKNVVVAGLFLNWEAVDWGRRRIESRIVDKNLLQVGNTKRQAEAQILLQVNAAHRQLQQSKQELQVAKIGQEVATEQLRVVSNRYKVQATLLRDVLKSQRDLSQANYQYTQALLGYWTARADLEKAMGED